MLWLDNTERFLGPDGLTWLDVARLLGGSGQPPGVSTAYFAIAELLANIAKHSGASEAHVDIRHADGALRVAVHDNGAGGADVKKGKGLKAVERRLMVFDGPLAITSPDCGPTTVAFGIPSSTRPTTERRRCDGRAATTRWFSHGRWPLAYRLGLSRPTRSPAEGPVEAPQPRSSRFSSPAVPLPVASRWPDAFGRRNTRQDRPTSGTRSDQAERHTKARPGTTQHERSRSRNA